MIEVVINRGAFDCGNRQGVVPVKLFGVSVRVAMYVIRR